MVQFETTEQLVKHVHLITYRLYIQRKGKLMGVCLNIKNMIPVILACTMLCSCSGKELPYSAEVHTPADIAAANDAFNSKIIFMDGVGDFAMTPLKYGTGISDFALIVENNNNFTVAALVTFVFRNADGKVISAGTSKTHALNKGAKDVVFSSFGDGAISDFSTLEITAFIRDCQGESVYVNIPADRIKETDNQRTGAGRRIDLKYTDRRASYSTDYAVFYDSDNRVYRVKSFYASGNEGCLYTEFDYDHYDIIGMRHSGTAEGIPDTIYNTYKAMGYITDLNTEYTSLDGRVGYSFVRSDEDAVLLHCRNLSTEHLTWSWEPGSILFYSGGLKDDHWLYNELSLNPQEELWWDIGIRGDSVFWMMPSVATISEEETPVPIVDAEEKEHGHLQFTLTNGITGADQELKCSVFILFNKGDRIVGNRHLDFSDDDITINDNNKIVDLFFDKSYDSYEPYIQYRYETVPIPGV